MNNPRETRMCIACREHKNKAGLLRIINENGGLKADLNKKSGGRGAYICKNEACLEKAVRTNAFARHLKIKTSDGDIETLKEIIKKA